MRTNRPMPQDSVVNINLLAPQTLAEKINEKKRIILTMNGPANITVFFEGFWDGKLVRSATNSIERHYRMQRHRMIRTVLANDNKKEQSNAK